MDTNGTVQVLCLLIYYIRDHGSVFRIYVAHLLIGLDMFTSCEYQCTLSQSTSLLIRE